MKQTILTILTVATFNACNQSEKETQKQTDKQSIGLVELTTFKLNKGVSGADFVKSAEQMQGDFLEKQNGFVKRTLTVSGDTLWTDIVYWENSESQNKALQKAEKSPEIMPFMEKIDFNSVKMKVTTPKFSKEK
jgi:hypothetical protein